MEDNTGSTLEASGLTKIFPARVGATAGGMHPLSFSLEPGTFFTLLGPSGCGKTTTLRCIAGLEQPDAGMVRLGNDIFFDRERQINVPMNRRNIGMVFQSYAIWPHMTVFENTAFPLRVTRGQTLTQAQIKKRVSEALDIVEMGPYASRSATQLSGGQQQRVALARAIVRQPRLLLLDEPLSNLDARLRDEMRSELKKLQHQLGITTVYVTHDQSEALDMSDKIAVVHQGRLIQIGTPRDIYAQPSNSFVAKFMGSLNIIAGNVERAVAAGEIAKVTLPDGRSIMAAFPHAVPTGKVAVSIRPEVITLRSAGGEAAMEINSFSGTISATGFFGPTNRYTVNSGDIELQVTTAHGSDFTIGDSITAEFSRHDVLGLAEAE